MSLAFGVIALLSSLFAFFIPLFGGWVTMLSAIFGGFSSGRGFAFGLAAIILNLVNLVLMSPAMWLMIPFALFFITVQVIALVLLVVNNNKKKAVVVPASQPST